MDTKSYHRKVTSPVGLLSIKVTNEGLRTIHFSQDKTSSDQDEHPLLDLVERQLKAYFAGERGFFDIPLAPEGTDFQLQVWEALKEVPFGKTRTYQEQAKQLGNIKAIRAVAAANGRNPIPIVIPCHRIIGSDGSLTGFSGGLDKKQWLLDFEAKQVGNFQMKLEI